MRRIEIFDTTLRDGEQSAGVNLHLHEKLEIAHQLERYGVDVLEAGFPASSRGEFQAVQQIARTVKNCVVAGLARSTERDIDAVWEAVREAAQPRLHVFIATSPIHMEYKLRMTPEQVLETAVAAVRYGARHFSDIEWSAEDATRSDWDFLALIIERVIDAGATVINLPDTVGYITPDEYKRMFQYLLERVPNIHRVKLSAHCHDDLGLAVANTLAAIEAGVHQVEGTINGIGERAGNASLEEVGVALAIRKEYYQATTRLNLRETVHTSKLVSKLTGMVVPPNKAVVGVNAFAHESGIHQDGVLKHKLTYEIIRPEMVGWTSNSMVLGKHSGRHAFREKCAELKLELSEAEFEQLFNAFKALTEKKKEITDDDILALYMEMNSQAADSKYELQFLHVWYGTNGTTTATVGIRCPDGRVVEEAATGKGSVEAIYNTIERALGTSLQLIDYRIQSTTGGRDSLAEVYVKVETEGWTGNGRGVDNDVLAASAKAYLDAINRIHLKQQWEQSTTTGSSAHA
ncbi:2-isopropylmalate synthase [Alicyclobacillus cellulosilyticus]|uniref:2-isopropylmalate synthase n=1 Tax=Alicyclobacillus cellulosilyticus TaxID=1003997 RepID=A0A917K828_9BACL|nr:2-isopropylmalate synthase [Alicyclobacillus cellulosilyticus]GGJ02278.1 2-isopropylmalate synthase [Alicyclobacillus cellulosilyticus]